MPNGSCGRAGSLCAWRRSEEDISDGDRSPRIGKGGISIGRLHSAVRTYREQAMKGIEDLKWGSAGLIPAIVQDAVSQEVLTVAYVSRESLAKTLELGETVFYSRSRQ